MPNPYQNYQNNAILTAKPEQLTLMLYNGALKFTNIAIDAIEKDDYKKLNDASLRAQNIISELQSTLDMDYEVSREMDSLYTFIKERLVEGNIHKDKAKIQDARDLIREFRDLWQEVIKQNKQ